MSIASIAMPVNMPLRSLFLAVIFLPTTLFYFGLATSLASGVGAAALFIVLVVLAVPGRVRLGFIDGFLISVPVIIFVVVHLLVVGSFFEVDFDRAIVSLVPLFITILAGVALGGLLPLCSEGAIVRGMRLCLLLLLLSAALGVLELQIPSPRPYKEPAFPFTEPSHLALVFAPVLMFCCATSKALMRLFIICAGFVVALSLQSLTLMAGLSIIVILCTRGIMLPLTAVLAGVGASALDLTYYANRLSFTNTQNLSALVYIQGWQLMIEALGKTHGWGIGFQQFGLHNAHSDASDIIFAIAGNNVNLLDGGFTFAKLAGEFGIFGILLSVFFLVLAAISFIRLKKSMSGKSQLSTSEIFAYCIFLAYPMELFVRGLGFFTPTFLLVISALQILARSRRRSRAGTAPLVSPTATPSIV